MQRFAVFDIDGTLIRWQLYHAVVDRLAKQGLLGAGTHEIIHEARMVWKNRKQPDAFHLYEQTLISAFEASLPSLPPKAFDELVDTIIKEYKNQVYTYTRNLIKKLKTEGYFLMAISGSHQELVEKIGAHYGFDAVVGTRYGRDDKRFIGDNFIASQDKKSVLQNLMKQHELDKAGSIAVGDTKSDIALLESVDNPIAFNPEQALYSHAKKHKWPIVVERKNVIYELTDHDGKYLLA